MGRNAAKIRQLEAILDEGVDDIQVGQTRSHVDFDAIRKRIEELKRADNMETPRRRKVSSYRLGGAW